MKDKKIVRVIGIDYGTKRLGMAIGQTITKSAEKLTTLKVKNGLPDWQTLDKIVRQWQPDAFVIGVPINMDGTEQPLSKEARNFGEKLSFRYNIPYFEADERLTTKDAKERLFKKGGFSALQDGQVDELAAKLILENWLQGVQP